MPALGDYRLNRIDPELVEELRADLRQKGLGTGTVNNVTVTLGGILKRAVRLGYIPSNPVALSERSYTPSAELTDDDARERRGDSKVRPDEILNAEEIRRLLECSKPGFYRTLFTLAAATGMRSGELFALRWSDVSFDADTKGRGQIYVRQSLSWSKEKGDAVSQPRFFPPKTEAGIRTVPVPREVVTILKEWKLACPVSELHLVFPTPTGQPARRSNVLALGFEPALKRAKLRRITMHSLRHSYASALILHGAPVTEVQKLLGHSNPAITLSRYSHWFSGAESGSTERMADALFGNRG